MNLAQYSKAYICTYENGRPNLGTRFYVQFNPAELSIDEAIGMEEEDSPMGRFGQQFFAGGIGWQYPAAQTMQQKHQDRMTLSATLFFNTLNDFYQTSYEDVREYIQKLYPYTNKGASSKSERKQIYFFWGSIAVAGLLKRLHVQYTMFAPDGKPVRAQAEISIAGDYVGEKSTSPPATSASGEYKSLPGQDANLPSDPKKWREMWGSGNPRS